MPDNWHGVVADSGYLSAAMDHFRHHYSDAVFVVASDDMEWCHHNIDASQGDVNFIGDPPSATPTQQRVLSLVGK